MPLLSSTKQEPRLAPTVPPPGASEVFVIRCTRECIKSYEEYTVKRTQYALPQWQEKYFNKSGLTYEEALAIERSVEEQIRQQFPKSLEGDVVRQIHHATLRKDDLINKVHASLKQASPGADKENGQQDSPAAAPSSSQAAPVTKKLLTQFLIYAADKVKPGVWICKEQWVKQYGLAMELPQGVQPPATEPTSPGPSAAKTGSAAGDATPMKTPLRSGSGAGTQPAQVRTLEEEETRLKPGSIKAIAFQVMKARGASQPVTADDIIRITTTDGTCIDWPDKRKRTLVNVLSNESAFVRLARGQYTLRALAGDLPLASPLGQGQGAAASGGAAARRASQDAMAAAFSGGASGAKMKPPKAPKEAPAAAQAADEEQQQSGLARAEQSLAQTLKAVTARQADADAAAAYVEACQKNLADAKEAKAAVKPKGKRDSDAAAAPAAADDKAAAAGAASGADLDEKFALPEHLREYGGPEDDRKAKSAWRHERSNEEKRLKKEREAYLQQQRLEAAKGARADLASLQQALDRAKKAAEEAAGKLERAQKAQQDAKRGVEREKQREMLKDIKEKSKADKEKQKQAEKEDRERRRLEALAAKRYPIDDLELLTEELTAAALAAANGNAPSTSAAAADGASMALLLPPEQLDVPCLSDAKHLEPEQSVELGQLLYVADTLSQFARQLGVKGCSSSELQAAMQAAGAAEGVDASGQRTKQAQRWLGHTYQQLLKVLVEDVVDSDGAARLFSRWSEVLACGADAWPELTRRWVLMQQQEGMASSEAVSAAHFLRDNKAGCLSPSQHLALLSQLLDDCLDTSLIRDMLSNRIDEAAERAAAVRAELLEGRRKLRELVDAEKESRKRKRAAALALATAAAERQLREKGELPTAAGSESAAAPTANGSAAADGAAPEGGVAAGAAAGGEDQVAKKIKNTTREILERVAGPGISGVTLAELEAELAADVEEEPAWELPAELREYSGPAGDKKAMSEFRRKQQEARKQMEKTQARWAADKSKRDKAKAEAKKREVEAERKLQQERQRAEEALADQQERLEQQLEKFSVRRQPLGNDRYNRLYWWGLAGNKEGLLLQQEVGCADTMLPLLQEAAAEAAAAKQEAAAEDDAQQDGETLQQQSGAARRVSVAEAGVDKELIAPLNHKGLLLPPGPEGWAVLDDVALLEGLAGGLEQRGVREKELKASLEKMMPSISAAIAKAAATKAAAAAKAAAEAAPSEGGSSGKRDRKKDKEAAGVIHRELPSRHARSAAAEQIRKTGSAAVSKGKEESVVVVEQEEEEPTGPLQGWTFAAFKSAVANLQELSEAAAAAKAPVPGPSSSWAKYCRDLDALLQGQLPEDWADEAAACAAAITSAPADIEDEAAWSSAGTGKDAAWIKAVTTAATAAAAARDAPAEQQQAAVAAAAVSQLRLQLLAFEQQLVFVSGECPYLYGTEDATNDENEAGAGSDAEGQVGEHDVEAAAEDTLQQQQQTKGRGTKRSAAAAAAAATPTGSGQGDDADVTAGDADAEVAAPAAKRRRAASDAGLPPRPAARAPRGKAATAANGAEDEGEAGAAANGHSPGSREGSAAPSSSDTAAAAAAAAAKGGSKKRSRAAAAVGASAAGSSRAASQEPQQEQQVEAADEEEEQQQQRNKKQQAQRGKVAANKSRRGKHGAAAAASGAAEEEAEEDAAAAGGGKAVGFAAAVAAQDGDGDAMDVDEEQDKDEGGRRRHSLPNKHAANHGAEDDGDVHEEVAEESDGNTFPLRLNGRTIWRTLHERDSWRNSVAGAATAAGLAYCAAALVFHAEQPMQKLAASMAKKGKKAGGRK